jgi:arsenite methyltransferase
MRDRHAGNAPLRRSIVERTAQYAARVLDSAQLSAGMTLLDVGTGEGLIGFEAIERFGPSLRVLMTDVSLPLLKRSESLAIERGVRQQCTFVLASAEKLNGIASGSVDAVTTRAVLTYVPNKMAALHEFLRVLKPGGRLSIAEPIFQDDAFLAHALRGLVEKGGNVPGFVPLLHRWKAAQFPDTEEARKQSPIANFSERDLIGFAHRAGFADLHLELHIDLVPAVCTSWELFLQSSPHPLAPTLATILAGSFSDAERQLFEQYLRPIVENPETLTTVRLAYLTGRRPSA